MASWTKTTPRLASGWWLSSYHWLDTFHLVTIIGHTSLQLYNHKESLWRWVTRFFQITDAIFGTVIVFLMVRENSSQQMKIYSHFSRFCTKWPHDCITFKLLGTITMQIFCRNVLPPWSVLNFLKMKTAGSSEIFASIPQTAVSWSVKRVPNLKVWLLISPSATNVTEI